MNKELDLAENKLINKEKELCEVKNNYEERARQLERTNNAEREKAIVAEREAREGKEHLKRTVSEVENLKKELNLKNKQLADLSGKHSSLQSQFST